MRELSKEELQQMLSSDKPPQLIDVRTPQEYEEGTIDASPLIPHTEIDQRIDGEFPDKEREYVVFCRTDGRSQMAAEIMQTKGYNNVFFLRGGYSAWSE